MEQRNDALTWDPLELRDLDTVIWPRLKLVPPSSLFFDLFQLYVDSMYEFPRDSTNIFLPIMYRATVVAETTSYLIPETLF